MKAEAAVALTTSMVHQAMDKPRMQRSTVYVEGMRTALLRHTYSLTQVTCRWPAGTVECDAFWAGVDEGNALWRARVGGRIDAIHAPSGPVQVGQQSHG